MQSTSLGQWGPGGPAVTSHYFSKVWSGVTDGRCLFRVVCTFAYDTYFEGCFFDLRLLLLCIGVWPCHTVYVHMLK